MRTYYKHYFSCKKCNRKQPIISAIETLTPGCLIMIPVCCDMPMYYDGTSKKIIRNPDRYKCGNCDNSDIYVEVKAFAQLIIPTIELPFVDIEETLDFGALNDDDICRCNNCGW